MATKEELLLRALNTTNMSDQIHEDLSDLVTMITPRDVPLFARLRRSKATALLHEWTETTLATAFSTAKYADGGIPDDDNHTHSRLNNQIMSIGRVAKATGLLRAVNLVGQVDALARELEEKMIDIMRVAEYYIYNGDISVTNPQEMDGLLNLILDANGSTVVDATSGTIDEDNLKSVIVGCYNNGGAPDMILARPATAQAIAGFTQNNIRYVNGDQPGGVGPGALRYLNPFGAYLEVIPVRTDFLATNDVLVLDSTKISLPFLSQGIEVEDLAKTTDSVSKLIKAYLTLEVRALTHHGRITNCADPS